MRLGAAVARRERERQRLLGTTERPGPVLLPLDGEARPLDVQLGALGLGGLLAGSGRAPSSVCEPAAEPPRGGTVPSEAFAELALLAAQPSEHERIVADTNRRAPRRPSRHRSNRPDSSATSASAS